MIATMAGPLHRSRLPLMCRLLISSCLPWPWLAEIRQLGRWIEKEPVPVQTPPSVDCHVPCCRSSIPWEYGRPHQHQVPLAARRLQQQGADAFEGTAQARCPGRVLRTDGPRIGRAGPAKARLGERRSQGAMSAGKVLRQQAIGWDIRRDQRPIEHASFDWPYPGKSFRGISSSMNRRR